ncbi:Putative clathrin assembly protein [Prunus dulcis]|uniref:Clathrin assembly protein n=1 Tax=Prunus dulcis TaxID=3755 RepID=A0A4Y1QUM3_PRUDU|nr:Putative clathrin assembly protein [Prunus dulcis]
MLVHRLLNDGDPVFGTRSCTRPGGDPPPEPIGFQGRGSLELVDHSAFVRTYALYLDQRLELMLFERKSGGGGVGDRQSSIGSNGSSHYRSPPPRNYEYEYGGERDREFRDYENGGG